MGIRFVEILPETAEQLAFFHVTKTQQNTELKNYKLIVGAAVYDICVIHPSNNGENREDDLIRIVENINAPITLQLVCDIVAWHFGLGRNGMVITEPSKLYHYIKVMQEIEPNDEI